MIKFWRGRAVQRGIFALLGLVLAIGLSVIPAFSQTPPNPFRVATEATFPPFEFQQGGQLTGFDIDLMRAIGKEADLNIDFRNLPFDGIIPALQARTVEAAISGMTITSERAQAISFSRPYFRAGLAIAVREDNRTIKNFEDLKGKRIAVQIGTTGALEATKIPGATVSQFDSAALALQELINGRVEAVVNDKPVTLYAIKQAGLRGVKVVGELLTEEFYGIALPKNSPYLQLINDALGRVIESGQYDAIFRQWFGEKPPELPLVAPALKNFQESSFNWGELFYNLIFKGVPWTILLTVLSFLFGLIGGTLVAIALISPYKWLKIICRIYVDFFRGTPMLVQLFLIYFGLPGLFREIGLNIDLDRLPAALFALSLNVAAYLAEIMRGGIQSIDNGQWEACSSLGMSPMQTMREVIFPQAFRRMLPPLGNEFITLIKDTSLAAVIGFEELFRQGQLMVATTYKAFEIYIAVAVVYLVLTTLSSVVFKRLEIYMDPLHKSKQEQKA
ncbi:MULTISPECIES: ABC transporter permease subunit [unclassified Microcystis]|jgi:arginine/lysine/histidine/glutamine transport system substrate-binding/permease protein|uniref:Transporter substrate-binding domain-containing protein n=1 Tax=Microcystis aeruginosa Ma_QC_Ca_00000000_S207 TaxID=2486251 RepID=A0A552FBT9_MICAE|nr:MULTISPECIES: ABC transporter permease subunit [unclassified Microcystis]MCA2764780.1 ABC transporter permease subunit [Microcystis sp. M151S2]MCA2926237.1 ABC transporter permease subunit [Microcystis sp. M020S1]MCA2937487.1 ABC transporter permease subunit [Microcystis sp. M015S1]TRU44162.1 MAG: transporter substrate-binding domain-containing protein [Microcystis aeruginosa Ma_QC_Ca_00000000_S207]MCA2618369.1 ABC transporter permease subunit [Microcystis sp. M099S2]